MSILFFRNKRFKLFLTEFYTKGSLLYTDAVKLIKKIKKAKGHNKQKVQQSSSWYIDLLFYFIGFITTEIKKGTLTQVCLFVEMKSC